MEEKHDVEQSAYDERLQHRLKILVQMFKEGKMRIPNDPQITKSLMAVRCRPDGEVYLETVDGLVRSMALTVAFLHDREELKKANPLGEIQRAYFDFLERTFGSHFKLMKENKLTPHDAGRAMSRRSEVINAISSQIPAFIKIIENFWATAAEAVFAHVEDMDESLKGVFGGDLFPSHNDNIASKCGVYADTIILPDPFLRSKDLFLHWQPKDRAYFFIKHALNLLQYKELACADVAKPIIVIVPDKGALDEKERDFYVKLGKEDAIEHAARMFGCKFESFDELMNFAGTLDTVEKVVSNLKDESRVLFSTDWAGDLTSQIKKAIEGDVGELSGTKHPGVIVASQAMCRMAISNEILLKASWLRATPIIDAPTSWMYLNWKLEYDAGKAELQSGLKDLHMLRGLQAVSEKKMQWLGRVPADALIELRKTGALEEIRQILGKGIEELATANPHDFCRTTDQVFINIDGAFKDHKRNIEKLSAKKWRFASTDIASWLVVGTIEVTAAATGLPVWGLATIMANQVLDIPKLKDIPASVKKLIEENRKLKRSPVGLLFACSDNNG